MLDWPKVFNFDLKAAHLGRLRKWIARWMRLGGALGFCDNLENRRAGLVKSDVTISRNHLTDWQKLPGFFFQIFSTTAKWFLEVVHDFLFLSTFWFCIYSVIIFFFEPALKCQFLDVQNCFPSPSYFSHAGTPEITFHISRNYTFDNVHRPENLIVGTAVQLLLNYCQ